MFRRSASSLLLAGLLFADGSWLGRLERMLEGLLGGNSDSYAAWANSERGGSIDPGGRAASGSADAPPGGSTTAERGVTIDPNG